jgi:hypothetical protein
MDSFLKHWCTNMCILVYLSTWATAARLSVQYLMFLPALLSLAYLAEMVAHGQAHRNATPPSAFFLPLTPHPPLSPADAESDNQVPLPLEERECVGETGVTDPGNAVGGERRRRKKKALDWSVLLSPCWSNWGEKKERRWFKNSCRL